MSNQKKSNLSRRNSAILFLDYKPAEIKKGKRLQLVYHYKNPISKEWIRVRLSVPKAKNKTERKEIAVSMREKINGKLKTGWIPLYDSVEAHNFKTFDYCSALFIDHAEKEVAKLLKRPDTLRAYRSNVSMIKKFIDDNPSSSIKMMFEFNKTFIINYLDWIFYYRNNSASTHNNHLTFINTFLVFCLERGFVKYNQSLGIKKKPKTEKIRKVLTPEIKKLIRSSHDLSNSYYCLCMMTYYCFIRRTELTKLKVKDINLENNYILLDGSITKNKKTSSVTIPKDYKKILKQHLKNANLNHYLFSADNFKVGKNKLEPKKISDRWTKFKKLHHIGKEFQFYSLKDTGITDLLNTGVPSIKVRDQARHYDLSITERYIDRNTTFDEVVLNTDFSF